MSDKTEKTAENTKSYKVAVRLDEESAEILKAYCEKTQMGRCEAMRLGIKKLQEDIKK